MTFFDEVEELFGTKCLYTALNVAKDVNEKQLRKAYHKKSLLCHPDRTNDKNKENSTRRFQVLSKIYSILSNSEQRAVYDETGELLDEVDVLSQERDWILYWRLLFKKISTKDIEVFEKEFKETDEETEQVKKYYLEFQGDMEQILNNVMCATECDEERFKTTIQKCIDAGELPAFESFTIVDQEKRHARKQKASKEEKEACQHAKDLGVDTNDDLNQILLKRKSDRQGEMNNFFNDLEAKYCQPKKKKMKNKTATTSTSTTSTKRKRK